MRNLFLFTMTFILEIFYMMQINIRLLAYLILIFQGSSLKIMNCGELLMCFFGHGGMQRISLNKNGKDMR